MPQRLKLLIGSKPTYAKNSHLFGSDITAYHFLVMSGGGAVIKTLLIWAFASAIIALGLKELYKIHGGHKSVSRIEVDALIRDLQGDVDVKKAAMNPQNVQAQQDSGTSQAPSQAPQSVSEVVHRLFPDVESK